ncbi:serine protease, partial [Planococcus sp. SIMBA_160]
RPVEEYVDLSFLDSVEEMIGNVTADTDVSKTLDEAKYFTTRISHQLQTMVTDSSAGLPEAVPKPELSDTDSMVAVHNVP